MHLECCNLTFTLLLIVVGNGIKYHFEHPDVKHVASQDDYRR
jgi:hypothetical protein